MSAVANPARGEVAVELGGQACVLRPSFAALVATEGELGPLLALVDRAAEGHITLTEIAGLFWHCRMDDAAVDRAVHDEAVAALGLARAMPAVRGVLHQILAGSA